MSNSTQISQHTEGPWTINVDGCGDTFISGHNGEYVADLGAQGDDPVRLKADAHLIAASPELLAALERLMPTNVCLTNPNVPDRTLLPLEMNIMVGEMRSIAALITKAKGGAA